MRINYLIKGLSIFFKVAFWFTLVLMIFNLSLEIFTKDGELGALSGTHHSKGYALPVKVQMTINDSIVNYKSEKSKSNGAFYFKKGFTRDDFLNSKYDSIINQPNVIRTVNKSIINVNNREDSSFYELTNSRSISNSSFIYVKSSLLWLEALLFVRGYVALISLVLIFYFLKEIFKILNRGIEFKLELVNMVKRLGIALIFLVVFKLALSFIFHFYFDSITITTIIQENIIANPTNILILPRLEFNLSMFLIGLSMIILGVLLNEGNRIQQENELTI